MVVYLVELSYFFVVCSQLMFNQKICKSVDLNIRRERSIYLQLQYLNNVMYKFITSDSSCIDSILVENWQFQWRVIG